MSAEKIITDWKNKTYKPVYWLEGEEPYFIDQVMHYAEHSILTESEAGFNLTVFYGRDADWASVVNACRRYPMFAERQVVLLKEAQQMRDIEKLEGYIDNPLPSTVFVVSYKDKKLDGRTKFAGLVKKKGEILSTKKLYENQLPEWAQRMVERHGLTIQQKALALLVDHIGNDLNRLQNEIEKLAVNLGNRKNINEDDIEEYIGVSKEFNVFELQDAIAKKDIAKAIRIIQYFKANPKAAPIQLILPTIYGFFSKVYSIFGMDNKSEQALIPLFNRNPFAARTGLQATQAYGYAGVERVLLLLHQYNLRSIGINDAGTDDADLLKELVVKMMATNA
ncbi:DNA polymerase III subunit delta [Foetidibacter luteolus]|uniref:DNA polymerase III subunit delta n=1 Tax=Foetidibacter luteolus TaxID=2608880 RepID=UPI00129B1F3A|nr:DNA polymerase III subunit delta [Foetidibacter luteolus]